ncbi:hypothetical protein [Leptospira stimsonii]|uniref:Uncharacterized protein n=1 Tax=Leptospira stimsonii TaxID=2202203 RepID=A0ABY2MWF8_9LEPT|nr:hypothetical protein [Leptospira stimsonii]TGK12949.1 hypothetical protein EHO98_19220 [Leptospira stimsonii]TGM10125.1 hypothetical protein EHQ90_19525 [Leptospira stimsonii]
MFLNEYQKFKEEEEKTESVSKNHVKGWNTISPMIVNFYLKLQNSLILLNNQKSDISKCYICLILLRLPFKIEALSLLINKGYYLESQMNIRNLYEAFIKIRYFLIYPEKAGDHLFEGKNKKVSFKVMFNCFSETKDEFYNRFYGNLLSEFSHSGIGEMAFTLDENSLISKSYNTYSEKELHYSLNLLQTILIGFQNFTNYFFQKEQLEMSSELIDFNCKIKNYFEEWAKFQVNEYDKFIEFYNLAKPIITL